MLRHECAELIREIRPVFREAGYDLRVGDQAGMMVNVFIVDEASGTEDPKPVHVKEDLIRARDSQAILKLLASYCPLMGLLRVNHLTGYPNTGQLIQR